LNKSLTALNALPLLILKIFEYKLVIVPVVDVNVVIAPVGVVIDGIDKATLELINQEKLELLVFIKPNVLELL
jgi:hypothetical protein